MNHRIDNLPEDIGQNLHRNNPKAELTTFAYRAAISSRLSFGNASYLEGTDEDDYLPQTSSPDVIYGMVGNDTILGQTGKDVLRDSLQLPDNIRFNDLSVTQGEGEFATATVINYQSQTLGILNNVNVETIAQSDFTGKTSFNFNFADSVPLEAREAIAKAGAIWSSKLADDVAINLEVDFTSLDKFTGGEADSNTVEVSYQDFSEALNNDVTSENDNIAQKYLWCCDSFPVLINNTQENQGSDEPYTDNNGSTNNTTIDLTNANAKALGFEVSDSTDATITFNNNLSWDFDSSDGLNENSLDLESIALHEIGHTLGFTSGVDSLDIVAGNNLQQLIAFGEIETIDIVEFLGLEDVVAELGLSEIIENIDLNDLITGSPLEPFLATIQPDIFISEDEYIPTSMDLFRFSDFSSDLGIIDFTTGETPKYFSLDRGQTKIAELSTGVFLGDGGQISHWKQQDGIGIMQPGINSGEIIEISNNDLQVLDAIGWDIASL